MPLPQRFCRWKQVRCPIPPRASCRGIRRHCPGKRWQHVCLYRGKDTEDTTTTPSDTPENPDETTDLRTTISGNKNLKVGFPRTYTATITDENGNVVEWDNTYSWNVVSNFEVGQEVDGSKIELLVEDEDCVDSLILLQVINTTNNSVMSEIEITVVDIL